MLKRLRQLKVEDLLKIVLVLVIIWLALEILEFFLQITLGAFRMLQPLLGVLLVVLLALWLLDRL